MVFKKGVRNIQAAAYNVTRTMLGISMAADITATKIKNVYYINFLQSPLVTHINYTMWHLKKQTFGLTRIPNKFY